MLHKKEDNMIDHRAQVMKDYRRLCLKNGTTPEEMDWYLREKYVNSMEIRHQVNELYDSMFGVFKEEEQP